ncbi:hypothetical protein ACE10W_05150 [Bradyrhizobium sp. B025]|uniref:hypothetical protein n=1 Tax=Bradyrhizobium sp. B025 TaxID=3344829 RepID=UPI0035D3FC07
MLSDEARADFGLPDPANCSGSIMQVSTSSPRDLRPSHFKSPKCRGLVAIPVHDVLLRHALEQASLDSSVQEIHYRDGPLLECPRVSLAGVVLRTEVGAFLLRAQEVRPEYSEKDDARRKFVLRNYGLQLLERDAQDILREPMHSNARNVWSHAGERVSLTDRLRLSVALNAGPQRIVELEERVRLDCDVVAAICVLACENLVQLRLCDAPLGPETIVVEA